VIKDCAGEFGDFVEDVEDNPEIPWREHETYLSVL
jgi:hypothetical protein